MLKLNEDFVKLKETVGDVLIHDTLTIDAHNRTTAFLESYVIVVFVARPYFAQFLAYNVKYHHTLHNIQHILMRHRRQMRVSRKTRTRTRTCYAQTGLIGRNVAIKTTNASPELKYALKESVVQLALDVVGSSSISQHRTNY